MNGVNAHGFTIALRPAHLREWWKEYPHLTGRLARKTSGINSPDPDLSGEVAMKIIWQHLELPAMWAIFLLPELLAMDEKIRNPDPHAERINVPAIMPFYWRYRMHITTLDSQLAATAQRHGLIMVTRNIADFKNAGVKLLNPFSP